MNRDDLPEQQAFSFTIQGQQVQHLTARDYYNRHPTQKQQRPASHATHDPRYSHQRQNQPKQTYTTTRQPDIDEEEYDDEYPPRFPTVNRRYDTALGDNVRYEFHPDQVQQIPRRRSRIEDEEELQTERPGGRHRQKTHVNALVWLGVGMMVMIVLWIGYNNFINWWTIHQDDSTYGRPRTFQIDKAVGHNDSTESPSHFIALNLNRHVEVIELPGGDSSKAKIYNVTTLYGDGQDLTPVTLTFKDVNGDGLLDMEIHIQDQTIALINDQGGFRPLKPGEKIHL